GWMVWWHLEKHYRAEVDRQLSSIADLRVKDLQLWRQERLGDGEVLFQNPGITSLVSRFLGRSGDKAARKQLLIWFEKEEKAYGYSGVRLLDAHGVTRLASSPELYRTPSVILKSTAEVLRSGKVTLQDFYRNEYDHHIYLGVLIPIR